MKKLFFITLAGALAAGNADAKTVYLACKRYESKCSGDKCYELTAALQSNSEWRETLASQNMEPVEYIIREDGATAILSRLTTDAKLAGGKYIVEFKYVTQDPIRFILENKTDTGDVKERIIIETGSWFYVKYLLHTDRSLRDVPIGEPFSAYFGWCEDLTDKRALPDVPIPAAPPAPATP
mgnify:CR=1 FL=1